MATREIRFGVQNASKGKVASTYKCWAHGGKLHNYFFAFGDNDVVVLMEAPDNEAVMATAVAVAGAGSVSGLKTTPLVSSSDAVDVFKAAAAKAGAYVPPASA